MKEYAFYPEVIGPCKALKKKKRIYTSSMSQFFASIAWKKINLPEGVTMSDTDREGPRGGLLS